MATMSLTPSSPLTAYLEYLIIFDSLKNVNLSGQGLYFIKANLYPFEPPEIFGLPLAQFSVDHQIAAVNGLRVINRVQEAKILKEDFSFTTRSFIIRFQQEEVQMFDAVTFTLKLPIDPLKGDQGLPTVILELDLYHIKASVLAASKKWLEANKETQQPKRVSRTRLKLNSPLHGLRTNYQVLFEERYFCRLDLSIYSSLLHISETRNYVSFDPPNLGQLSNATTHYLFGPRQSQSAPIPTISPTTSPNTSVSHLSANGSSSSSVLSLSNGGNSNSALSVIGSGPMGLFMNSNWNSRAYNIYDICFELLLRSHTHLKVSLTKLISGFLPKEKEMLAEAAMHTEVRTEKIHPDDIDPVDGNYYAAMFKIMSSLYDLGSEISTLWVKLLSAMTINTGSLKNKVEKAEKKLMKRWMECVIYESQTPLMSDPTNGHAAIVAEKRKTDYFRSLKQQVEDEFYEFNPDEIPIIFECGKPAKPPKARDSEPTIVIGKNRAATPSKATKYVSTHLFIMVHGLKGSSFDLRLYKNHISNVNEDSEFLAITSIEDSTLESIEELGKKVASEILSYLRISPADYSKISFIGHSLGGLIIRAALLDPDIAFLQTKFYSYITLGTPHLGSIFHNSSLIPSAMWFWEKWSAAMCLKQLRLIDANSPENSFLAKLALESKILSNFKHVVLLASEQDYYVPFCSARIELPQDTALAGKLGVIYSTMRDNLLASLANVNVVKFDIHFGPTTINMSKFDTITGRGAHIAMLDDERFVRMFVGVYHNFFV
eukprot:TRINITY_DN11436_c0_g1_i1.p1 TRINITY_DN11436_c0_g1~~TRINITY_DN11436_c0_g1_i1.p1  ORF type:complete len:771 (-),score=158.33 TRINITY_DN11436_c0_g1_i1:65-2377(-)